MDAVAASDGVGVLVLEGARPERGEQPVDIGDQDVGGAHELHVEAGVEHVGRRHALVHEAGVGPHVLGEVGEERDDVVLCHRLDLVDPRRVEDGFGAFIPDGARSLLRDGAGIRHGRGGMCLDLEPDPEARLGRPDRRHLGS